MTTPDPRKPASTRAGRWRLALLALAAALPVALTACGSSANPSSAPPSTARTTTGSENHAQRGVRGAQFQAYIACLRKQGLSVELPARRPDTTGPPPTGAQGGSIPPRARRNGGGPGGGHLLGLDTSDPKVQAAMTACQSLRPHFNRPGAAPTPGDNGSSTPAGT